MRGDICSRILDAFVLPSLDVPDKSEGGTNEGLTLARYTCY